MIDELGAGPWSIVAVVIATVTTYLVVLVLVRLAGPRTLTAMTATDVACVLMFGAVAGRTTLLGSPTLVTGAVALAVLVVLQCILRSVRARPPVTLMADGVVDPTALRRVRLGEDELRQRLRRAGITRRAEVWRAVLEPNGQISVLRTDPDAADPWIVADTCQPSAPALSRYRRRRQLTCPSRR